MQVDRDQLMRDGFLVLREMVAPDELDAMRASYDTIIERQGGDDWLGSGGAQQNRRALAANQANAQVVE